MNKVILIALMFAGYEIYAQELPYREIPAYPESYTGANVAARLVDGLGFRYYWATEGLREDDLKFEPVNAGGEARTSFETLNHIYGLSVLVVNAINGVTNVSGTPPPTFAFPELRKKTLDNLKYSSDKLKASSEKDLASYKIIFKNGETVTEYPFWNEINGPIADALWHVGQVVTFRRSSGNPFNSKVSVLQGKLRE
jgi:hypothetical protein